MNCTEIKKILSPYFDDHLESDHQTMVAQHLESCRDCSQSLADFQTLSEMAKRLTEPQPPHGLWSAIEQGLAEDKIAVATKPAHRALFSGRNYAITAAAVVACVGFWLFFPHGGLHSHTTVNFNHFLDEFPRDPDAAQQILLATYDHEAVNLEEAARQVRYQPVATEQLPNGYSLDKVYIMKMPSCTCVQCIYKGENNESLVLFEYDTDQPIWFGNRPAITCPCKGRKTKIIPFDGQLAASWSVGKRHLTVIGARDMEHVVALVDHFSKSAIE